VTVEVTRARVGSLLEWALAAGCAFTLAVLGSWVLHEARTASGPVVPVAAEEINEVPSPSLAPLAVPEKAVSVPFIRVSTGLDLRLGESESAVAGKIDPAWKNGIDSFERGPNGTRVTRAYYDGSKRFLLVFDPERGEAERHLAGIYLR
jgi:hypothetical protein